MKKTILSALILIAFLFKANGQINFQDSSVQVISYWDLGEKYEYSVSHQTLKYTDQDTTSNETITYDVDVSVIDSTSKGYTVRWLYKNIKTDSKEPLMQKVIGASEDISIDIELDEMGTILGVVNWEEVRHYMSQGFDTLLTELPDIPEIKDMINRVKAMYSTKESIEASAILDAVQVHNFYGGKYTLNKTVAGTLLTQNLYYPDKPFDTDVSVTLEHFYEEKDRYRIRSINEVNAEQLTETTYNYLTDLFKGLGQEMPPREEFKNVSNTIETVAIIHNTGWVLDTVQWKEVVAEGITNMEIRRIKMK